MNKTKYFIISNSKYIDALAITIATPFPGTTLWHYSKEHNIIPESFNWDCFRFVSEGMISVNEFFNRKQLEKIRFWMLINVFLRFNIKFSLYYLRYPAFILSKFAEVLNSFFGTKPENKKL